MFKNNNQSQSKLAAIFDMDGVVAHTIPFHARAWIEFGKRHGFKISKQTIYHNFSGRVNKEILEILYKRRLSKSLVSKLVKEKESLYRSLYRPHIKVVKGLPVFLEDLKKDNIRIALATAAPPENVSFILNATKIAKYFKIIVNATDVRFGKPNPAIFLKAAKKLKIKPELCIVFEDAMLGIQAARRAGMKVVGVATSHKAKELGHTDLVIKDFGNLTLSKLKAL